MNAHARAVAALLAVVAIAPLFVFATPQVIGASHSYVVLTSSMSPTINAGDAVLVSDVDPSEIQRGDIISFEPESGPLADRDKPITHRVKAIETDSGERRFVTKGDANDAPDGPPVRGRNVIGEVVFTIPYLGHLVAFAGSNLGILLLIVVPALLLVVTELRELLTATETEETGVERS